MSKIIQVINYLSELGTSRIFHIFGKQFIDLNYTIYGKTYTYRLKVDNNPIFMRDIRVIDGNGNDITSNIVRYMGPNYDFHNTKYTPLDFGYNQISIYEDDEFIKTYTELEFIIL